MSMNHQIRKGKLMPFWGTDHSTFPYSTMDLTDDKFLCAPATAQWVRKIEKVFELHKQTFVFYKLESTNFIASGKTNNTSYLANNSIDPDTICNAILMLGDSCAGQQLELDGIVYDTWKDGEWFLWGSDIDFALTNKGEVPIYSLFVTGQTIYSGQLNDLFCFNVHGIEESIKISHPVLQNNILPKIQNTTVPFMLYMDNGPIKQLDNITHDKESRNKLNEDGLTIYLYEPMCSFLVNATPKYEHASKHTCGFYSEFGSDIDPLEMRSEELDSIFKYAVRNGLTNITVNTCDYNVDTWYPYYSPVLRLLTDDLFLACQQKLKRLSSIPTPNFTKKFMCLNWRYTKHRHLLSTYVCQLSSYVSWYFKSSFDILASDLFFDLESWKVKYPSFHEQLKVNTDYINIHGPLYVDEPATTAVLLDHSYFINMWPTVDKYNDGVTPALFNTSTEKLKEYYSDVFVDIINETRFAQPTGNFSEKVFQSMQYLKPFVLVAPPSTLEYIRKLGYKTFSDFWDESYDDELNHGERMAKIFKVIDYIDSKSIDELREMYQQMMPILDHNLQLYRRLH